MQLPMFEPSSEWRPPSMDILPSWAGVRRVGIDVETCDPQLKRLGIGTRRDGYLVGVSISLEDGPSHYLPIRHAGGDNLPVEAVLGYLRDQGRVFGGQLVGANLQYDLDYLWQEGVEFPHVTYYRDVQVADPLIYELHASYSLQNIAKRWGLPGKDEDQLRRAAAEYRVDPKGGLWQLPARHVGAYAEEDARQPLLILRRQEREIEEHDLWDIYNIESQVLPVLVKMRRRGVRIDLDRLAQVERWSLEQETEALAKVSHQSGHRVAVGDVWRPDAIAPALESIGVVLGKTSKGKPNIDKDVLSRIDHPVAAALAWARKVNKLRTTFAQSIRTYMVGDRIHCTFNQIARETESGEQRGARYGRLSCVDPNMQQQPARDEFAKMWRSIYLPEDGSLWASLDYSQQEPRWTTHYAAAANLTRASEAAQAYHDNPDLDNHQFMADLTGIPRKRAKNIYLGLCYGEGGAKLCRDLELETRWAMVTGRGRGRIVSYFVSQREALEARMQAREGYVFETAGEEGQEILDRFDERAPFIRELARAAERRARERGSVRTVGGRRLNFPVRDDGSYDWTHKSLNRLIQGTSADQMKRAIVALDAGGHYLQLQVHDETGSSVRDRAEAQGMALVMESIMPARVPFRVDLEIGSSWGDSMS